MSELTDCCDEPNKYSTDDDEVIYPDLCRCICHTPDDD